MASFIRFHQGENGVLFGGIEGTLCKSMNGEAGPRQLSQNRDVNSNQLAIAGIVLNEVLYN